MKQIYIAGFLLIGTGSFLIGFNGGFWGVLGLMLYWLGMMCTVGPWKDKGPRTDWMDEDTFFKNGIGSVQAKMGKNYPPGFDERKLD